MALAQSRQKGTAKMARNLKALGLALLAAFALSAVVAQAASAVVHHFDTDHIGEELKVKALGTQEFFTTTNDPNTWIKCTEAGGSGSLPELTNADVTFAPTFGGCKAKVGASEVTANVTPRGCKFTFTGKTTHTEGETAGEHAAVHITGCNAPSSGEPPATGEKGIVVDVTAVKTPCVLVKEQTLHGAKYENDPETKNPGEAVIVNATIHGIHSLTTGSCVLGGVETHNDGVYLGKVTVSGKNGNKVFTKESGTLE
jgi:hypothetical protein